MGWADDMYEAGLTSTHGGLMDESGGWHMDYDNDCYDSKQDDKKSKKLFAKPLDLTPAHNKRLKKINRILNKHSVEHIYHITSYKNIKRIFKHGLESHNNRHVKDRIDNTEVNRRRDRVDPINKRKINSYVPFYFNPKNPMLFVNRKYQKNIVILAFNRSLIGKKKTIFTDGNAAVAGTKFYKKISDLSELNWHCINASYWSNFENGKVERMAEVLVKNTVKTKYLEMIICFDNKTKDFILSIKPNARVKVDKSFYF